jgi:acetyltransferase-like isoleucine patch superfamily enzyme
MNVEAQTVNDFASPADRDERGVGLRARGKSLLRLLFLVPAVWQLLRYRLACRAVGEDRAFLGVTERLARRAGYPGVYLRAATYRLILRQCARDVHLGFGTVLSRPAAVLGEHVYVGRYCSLGWVELGRDVMLADFVAIPSGGDTHRVAGDTRTPPRLAENRYRPVRIGEGTWLGAHATVLADVGRYCVIGAGAVVTRPIPEFSVAVGVPARVVGSTAGRAGATTLRTPSRRETP